MFKKTNYCNSSGDWKRGVLFLQIIDEKSLIKKYQSEISTLKQELEQLKRGMIAEASHEEIINLRQQVLHSLFRLYFEIC